MAHELVGFCCASVRPLNKERLIFMFLKGYKNMWQSHIFQMSFAKPKVFTIFFLNRKNVLTPD